MGEEVRGLAAKHDGGQLDVDEFLDAVCNRCNPRRLVRAEP